MYLRDAAERIRVLNMFLPPLDQRAALEQFAEMPSHHGLPRMRAHGMYRGMEGFDAAVVSIERNGTDDIRELGQPRGLQ
jgi:hypothetical protein